MSVAQSRRAMSNEEWMDWRLILSVEDRMAAEREAVNQ